MNDIKFTPAPWKFRHSDSKMAFNILGDTCGVKFKIARCPYIEDSFGRDKYESEANARLISCAPEMLEMIKEAAAQIEYLQVKFKERGSGNAVLSRIDSLIEKATK